MLFPVSYGVNPYAPCGTEAGRLLKYIGSDGELAKAATADKQNSVAAKAGLPACRDGR